jgi:hypothetical protein
MEKMFISRLLLVKYNRIASNGITRFLYEPGEEYTLQLILGSNGSGKSSIIHELWGLPASENDFEQGGRKEIDIHYKGKVYTITSSFDGKAAHHFQIDGVEMNEGGKVGLCLALCEEHLKVTPEIRALALGKDPLVTMTPGRRRYWLVKLADTDFTYAMGVYKKLCEAHRDAQGAIKRLQKRLVDERSKLVDDNVVKTLNAESREIRELIAEIYGLRNAEAKKGAAELEVLESNWHDLDRFGNEIDRLNTDMIEKSGFESRQDMEDRRDAVKMEVHVTQQMQQHLYADHSRIKKKYDMLIRAGTESLTELQARREKALQTIAYEENYISFTNVVIEADPVQMADTLKEIYYDLYEKMCSLPINDGEYSREKAELTEGKVSYQKGQLEALRGRIARLTASIEHQRDHVQQNLINCPKCQHSWSTTASDSDIKKAEEMLQQLKEDFVAMAAKFEKETKYLQDYSAYAESYRAVMTMMRSAPILKHYFNQITQDNRLMKCPGSVALEMNTIQSDLEHQVEIHKQRKIIEAVSEQIDLKSKLDADTLESIEADMQRLEEATGIQTKKLGALNNELKDIDALIAQHNRIGVLHEKMLNAYGVQEKHMKGYVYSRYQEALWEMIMALQVQLARKEDALSQINSQQAIVDEIQYQLDEGQMNERIAKAAHVALSPTSGAIAEGLHRFVNVFVGKMNKVINSIWSYPLELKPFKMEEGQTDLDYKFPFTRNKETKAKKDVIEGSESMLDIFNFAFWFCALQQLGLGHLPMFLDEFESAFDDIHREKAIYFIKKLLDENVVGQIFTVSHYESNHGALSGLAQTCVMSKDNLLLSSDIAYNEHVTIN